MYNISTSIDVQRVEGKTADFEMRVECNMFDVTLASESWMICGVLSCVVFDQKKKLLC